MLLHDATSVLDQRKIADYKNFDDKINKAHSFICLIRIAEYKENWRTSMYVNYLCAKTTSIDMGKKSSVYTKKFYKR